MISVVLGREGEEGVSIDFPYTPEDRKEELWLLNQRSIYHQRISELPEHLRPFFIHLLEVEQVWWASHGASPADWVESDEPVLAKLIARYFTSRTHQCTIR